VLAAPDQATKDRCTAYAKRAVEQYQLMKSHPQCQAHSDPLTWQDNYDNHYNGCMFLPASMAKSAEQGRDNHLQACGALSDATPAATDATPAAGADTATPSAPATSPTATLSPAPTASVAVVGGPFVAPSGAGAPGSIFIRKASYGANIDPIRASYKAVYTDVAGQCNGKADCVYVIDWHRIGDPFLGSVKDYEVLYSCGAEVKRAYAPPEAGFGSRIELTCPRAPAVVTAVNKKPKANEKGQPPAAK
jgi:hypothetical protein